MRTSFDNLHRHEWFKGGKFTTSNDGHNHKIDLKRRIALPNHPGGHKHRLLKS